MYCKRCGNPLAEGVLVCPACGYYEEPVQTTEQTNADAPAYQQQYDQQVYVQQPYDNQQYVQPTYDQQYAQQQYDQQAYAQQPYDQQAYAQPYDQQQYAQAYYPEGFANPSFESYEQPRKNNKKIIISAVAGLLAVVIVLTAVLNLDALKGFVLKTFASDAQYYSYVEKKALSEAKTSLVNAYGEIGGLFSGETNSVKNDISFTVGEDVSDMLSSDVANSIIKEINRANISFDVNQKDALSQIKLALEIAENPIVNLDAIFNMSDGKTYIGAPSLINDYLMVKVDDAQDLQKIYDDKLWNALPSKKTAEQLLDKYIDVVLSGIDDVKSSKAELTVADMTQKCTALEYGISEEDAIRIAEKVLNAVNSDSEIEKIINNINEYAIENDLCDSDVDMYGEFKEGVEDALEEIKDEKEDADSEDRITVITYVNSKHEVIGREISSGSQASISHKKVQKGSDFVSSLKVANMIEITGQGTEKNDVINGTYEAVYNGTSIFTATLTDFNSSEISDGLINGKVKITPDKALWSNLGVNSMISSAIKLYDPSIELVFDMSEKASESQINILGKDEIMLGITVKSAKSKSEDIKTPSNAVDTSNSEELSTWMQSLNIEDIKSSLKSNLEKAGVSSKITDAIVGLIDGIGSGLDDTDINYEDEIIYYEVPSDNWY